MHVRAGSLVMLGFLTAGCGARSNRNSNTHGSFTWMEGGKAFAATIADYSLGATMNGTAFTLRIVGIAPIGLVCELSGRFPAQVPPPSATYPIVPLLNGTMELPQADDTFVGSCTAASMQPGGFVLDPGRSGEVVLTASTAGDVAGSFTMEAALFPAVNSATTTFTGEFSVGCATGTDSPCGPLSTSGLKSCPEFLACCNGLAGADRDTCMYYYSSVAPNGDTACGRTLATSRDIIPCP